VLSASTVEDSAEQLDTTQTQISAATRAANVNIESTPGLVIRESAYPSRAPFLLTESRVASSASRAWLDAKGPASSVRVSRRVG